MQETVENDLIQCLQYMVTTYMDKNPSLTVNALASRSNIPVTSLRRLLSGQQKSEIAPHTVLNIVSYIHREKNMAILLTKVEASIAEFLKRHFGSFIFAPERVYDCDLNSELKDQFKYFIYKLAANHNGTDLMTIVENYGAIGKKKAEEMVSLGLLIREGDRLHAREKNFSLDLRVAADHLPALVQFYKPGSISRGQSTFFSMSESLNEAAINEIRQLQRECVQKIHAVMNRTDALGDIPYFTLNLAETMLYESYTGDLQ